MRSTKQRPALVIFPEPFNASHDDLLVVAITSQIPVTLAADKFLIPSTNLAACGLSKPSIIKLLKLVTLHCLLVLGRIGGLPEPTLGQVSARNRDQL